MAFKMKGFNAFTVTDKYGKRHSRLRKKGHELDDKAMDAFDAGEEKKAARLNKRARRKFDKAREIRNK